MRETLHGNGILKQIPRLNRAPVFPVIHLPGELSIDDDILSKHLLLIGNTRSGKTVVLKNILNELLINHTSSSDNAIIFCAKPDLLRYKRPQDICIRVDSSDLESCWNIFEELSESSHPELLVREISAALFENHKSSLQPFFYFVPKQIFEQAVLFLFDIQTEKKIPMDNKLLFDFLVGRPLGERNGNDTVKEIDFSNPWTLTWFQLAEFFPAYFSCVEEFMGTESMEQAYAILSEITSVMKENFFGSFCQSGGKFSALKTLRGEDQRVFLYYDFLHAKSCRSLFRIILDLLYQQAMRAENLTKHQRNYFFLEEFSQLPPLQNLCDSLSFGAEFGVRNILVLQSALLLNNQYTDIQAKTLLSLISNVMMFQTSDSFTREWGIQNRYGKGYFLVQGFNSGMSNRENIVEDNIVSDADLAEIVNPGDAIVAMPRLSAQPFFYRTYQK